MVIIGLTLMSFLYPFWPQIKRLVNRSTTDTVIDRDPAPTAAVSRDLVSLLLFGGVALVAISQSATLNAEAAVFPKTIAIAMVILVALSVLKLFFTRHVTEIATEGSYIRMAAVPALMMGAVFLIPISGFMVSAILLGLGLIIPAQHDKFSVKGWAYLIASVVGIVVVSTLLFSEVLGVPLP